MVWKGQELTIIREFEAPRAHLWRVWTDPVHLAQWWGPQDFSSPVCRVDLQPGGEIRIDMRAPEGVVHPMTGIFHDIVAPRRLVFSSSALDKSGKALFETLNTVVFTEQNGETTLHLQVRVVKATSEAAPHLKGMEMGWTQSLERLADYLSTIRK